MSNTRRKPSTAEQYRTRVRQLQLSAIARQTPTEVFELTATNPNDCSLADLFAEFQAWAPGKSLASWDLYRAAVLWHMRAQLDSNPSDETRAIYDQMNALRFPNAESNPQSGGIKKPNSLPNKDLDKIIDALLESNQRDKNVGIKTQCWMLAALATGLRPIEWETAQLEQLDGNKWVLRVKNSKRKSSIPAHMEVEFYKKEFPHLNIKNRFDIESHGFDSVQIERKMERTIEVSEKDLPWVQNHLIGIKAHLQSGGEFKNYYDSCRHALFRACNKAFNGKKMYSLYIMRHQFSANMKNIHSKEVVAELMGHDDIGSAPKDYASRKHGHPEFRQARQSTLISQASQNQESAAPTGAAGGNIAGDADGRQAQGS